MQWARNRRVVAAALVTVISFAVIGVVLAATTPIACGPARAVGLKSIGSQCGRPVANRTPPIPSASPLPTPSSIQVSPSQDQSPSPEASPTPIPSSQPPDVGPATGSYPPFVPAATGPGGLAIPGVSLTCRLPVFVGPPGSGGFVVFPGGAFIADPKSAVSLPSPSPGEPSPVPQGGYGQPPPGLSYDAHFSRWLPVPVSQVSPDGTRFAFVSPSSIYVEDVASGTLSEIGQGQAWTIVSVQSAGVYAGQPFKAGLWRVPYSGAPVQVTSTGFWQAGNGQWAYGTATSAVPQGVANTIIRVDLQTGAITNLFTRQGASTAVIGVDTDGAAILSVGYFQGAGVTEVWLASAADKAAPITGSGLGVGVTVFGAAVADSHGIWFAGNYSVGNYYNSQAFSGVALYVRGQSVYWMSNLGSQLAGGCVQP